MATELPSNLKRKTRNSSSSETASPDGKRISEASDSSDSHFTGESNMSQVIAQQLQQILYRLTSVEGKLDGVLQKVQHLETALNSVQSEIRALQTKTTKFKEATDEMDVTGNLFINFNSLFLYSFSVHDCKYKTSFVVGFHCHHLRRNMQILNYYR